jgi:hypothetical protein
LNAARDRLLTAPRHLKRQLAQIIVTLAKAVDGIARGLVLFHKEVFHAVVRGGAKNPGDVQYPVADFAESAGGHLNVEGDAAVTAGGPVEPPAGTLLYTF